MRPEQLLDAMSELDDDLLLDSEQEGKTYSVSDVNQIDETEMKEISVDQDRGIKNATRRRKIRWKYVVPLAACACAVIVVAAVPMFLRSRNSSAELSSEMAYDTETDNYETYEDDTARNESVDNDASDQGRVYSSDETSVSVVSGGVTYYELTEENASDYGIDIQKMKEFESLTKEDLGKAIGTVETSSDEILQGRIIYESQYDSVYIIYTENGFRYFCKRS